MRWWRGSAGKLVDKNSRLIENKTINKNYIIFLVWLILEKYLLLNKFSVMAFIISQKGNKSSFLKLLFVMAIKLLLIQNISSQTTTTIINPGGNWNNASIWLGNIIGDNINDNVVFNNNLTNPVTVNSLFNYTVGDVQMNQGNTLIIAQGGTLNIGASGTNKSLTLGNQTTIEVNGTLIIWGDVNIDNNLTLTINGNFVVNGNIKMLNGGNLTIIGSASITGNFVGGNNTNLNVDGTVDIGGSINVGNGSTATGNGNVTVGGGCTGNTEFCNSSPLPISLADFSGSISGAKAVLSWSTISEQNFDYFAIERSHNAKNYVQIGTVKGSGWSQSRIDYSFTDHNPMPGINYYRLKSVDFDGYTEIFPPISVFNDNVQVSVESPVIGKRLVLYSNMQGKAQLVNLFGGSVQSFDIDNGPNELALPGSLPRGLYILVVSNEGHLVKKTKIYVE
jgi:hypothetical protein